VESSNPVPIPESFLREAAKAAAAALDRRFKQLVICDAVPKQKITINPEIINHVDNWSKCIRDFGISNMFDSGYANTYVNIDIPDPANIIPITIHILRIARRVSNDDDDVGLDDGDNFKKPRKMYNCSSH